MSALAKLAITLGATVSGSDIADGEWYKELSALGASVYHGHNPSALDDADFVVCNSAIPEDDAELVHAREAQKEIYSRHRFLAEISRQFQTDIAVAGTHGKTTCTALISHIFSLAKKDFCAHIGGNPVEGSNLVFCGKDYFITEACEYKRAFCELTPDIAVILNLESDHPDCYKNTTELVSAFQRFVDNIRDGGTLVLNGETAMQKLDISRPAHIITFGYAEGNTCRADNLSSVGEIYSFDLTYKDVFIGRVESTLFGKHNVSNALACAAVCIYAGIAPETVLQGIATFQGVKRRFERRYLKNGAEVVFDYAHHPSEIRAAIRTAAARTSGTLRVYFQPHTYSRTSAYFEEFCDALEPAPFLGLVRTFPAREQPSAGLSALDLYSALSGYRAVTYFDELLGVSRHILRTSKFGDCALVLGAGDIYDISKLLF